MFLDRTCKLDAYPSMLSPLHFAVGGVTSQVPCACHHVGRCSTSRNRCRSSDWVNAGLRQDHKRGHAILRASLPHVHGRLRPARHSIVSVVQPGPEQPEAQHEVSQRMVLHKDPPRRLPGDKSDGMSFRPKVWNDQVSLYPRPSISKMKVSLAPQLLASCARAEVDSCEAHLQRCLTRHDVIAWAPPLYVGRVNRDTNSMFRGFGRRRWRLLIIF